MELKENPVFEANIDFAAFAEIIDGFDPKSYDNRMRFVKYLLNFYRRNRHAKQKSAAVRYAARLIQSDADYIRKYGHEGLKDSHNALVLRYVGDMSFTAISHKMGRTVRSVHEIIAQARERMVQLAFGIDGLSRTRDSPEDVAGSRDICTTNGESR